MKRRLAIYGVFVALLLGVQLVVLIPQQVYAAVDPTCKKGSFLGIEPWYKYLDVGEKTSEEGEVLDKCAIIGPLHPNDDKQLDWAKVVPRVLLAATETILRIAGLVAVMFTIYGGFMYILSQGEPDATKKAKGTIVGASVGVVIAIFATFIAGFVGSILWA